MKRKEVSLIALLLYSAFSFAQTISASLKADSSHIQIGDHLTLQLQVDYSKSVIPQLPSLKDTIGNLEVVAVHATDTTTTGDKITLTQNIVASAYDSGTFRAGPVPIIFIQNGISDTLYSNAVWINVNTLDVDTAKPFKPIKAPLKVPYTWNEFLWVIIPVLFLIMLAIAGYLMWKEQQKKKPVLYTRPVPKDPPHIWAIKELKKLEEEKVWQKDEVKLYYSRLTEILRLYLEYRYRWFALEETTEEIEARISDYITKEKAKEMLLEVLRAADLVKFAKVLPMPNHNLSVMETAYKFIEWTKPEEENENKKSVKTT